MRRDFDRPVFPRVRLLRRVCLKIGFLDFDAVNNQLALEQYDGLARQTNCATRQKQSVVFFTPIYNNVSARNRRPFVRLEIQRHAGSYWQSRRHCLVRHRENGMPGSLRLHRNDNPLEERRSGRLASNNVRDGLGHSDLKASRDQPSFPESSLASMAETGRQPPAGWRCRALRVKHHYSLLPPTFMSAHAIAIARRAWSPVTSSIPRYSSGAFGAATFPCESTAELYQNLTDWQPRTETLPLTST